jgi:amidohydrolase
MMMGELDAQKLCLMKEKLNSIAELGYEENKTSLYVKQILLESKPDLLNEYDTGIVATYFPEKEKRVDRPNILLRAELDALKLADGTIRHVCGHDAHMAILLLLSKYILKNRKQMCATVKLLFQPAEEVCAGAKTMIKQGVLENPEVEECYAIHFTNELPLGTIALSKRPMSSGAQFEILISGKTAHSAMPHMGNDCILLAATIIQKLNTIVSRNISPTENAVLTIAQVHGGNADNCLASRVILTGTIRYFNDEVKNSILDIMGKICKNEAECMGVEIRVKCIEKVPFMNNNDEVMEKAKEIVQAERLIVDSNYQSMCVDDFAEFLKLRKGAYIMIGCQKNEPNYPLHSEKFYVDDEGLLSGYLILKNIIKRSVL